MGARTTNLPHIQCLLIVFVGIVCLTSMAFAASRSVREKKAEPKVAGSTAVSAQTRQEPFFRIPFVLDKSFNPILMQISIYSWWYFLMPGLAGFVLGFGWPFYEYMKNGYTFYSPGIIWDKDFTEYFHWYFKHKIYKQKYWNLDAFLYAYYESHNENLKVLHNVEELKKKKPAAGYADGEDMKYSSDVEQASDEYPDKMEDILTTVMQDMIENNEYLRMFIQEMAGPDGYERIKSTVKQVMDEEFSAQKRLGLPVYKGYFGKKQASSDEQGVDKYGPEAMESDIAGSTEAPARTVLSPSKKGPKVEGPV